MNDYNLGKKNNFNIKIWLIVGLILLCIVGFLVFKFSRSTGGADRNKIFNKPKEVEFDLVFAHRRDDVSYFFLLNQGDANITSFNVKVDGINLDYFIDSGSLPIEPGEMLFLGLNLECKDIIVSVLSDKKESSVEGTFC